MQIPDVGEESVSTLRWGLSGQRREERKAGAGSETCVFLKHIGWSSSFLLVCQTYRNVPLPRSVILHKLSDSCIGFKTTERVCIKLGHLECFVPGPVLPQPDVSIQLW